ncbi:F-box/LRR-repeat protein At3g48880 isoform X2 [Punica granatum]|uniref:F-box/LRR-repeat protein At3g48880 isoform X2 n=1 Tax=Punica granatum TaxID=22663 RepID=A0A6P8DNG4_PUNGR|nr:F-box/LRR-repeat protein At3g48880 isoform X2 [Punica granatum]XP_031394861.1 F-box/LRR-repeat protein At3g48880 isoform X2 [Punica granatum]
MEEGSVSTVQSSWRSAACDPILWNTLDLSTVESNFIKIPQEPYVYVHARSHKTLTRLLKISLSLSTGCITNLIFHYNLYFNDEQLNYTAQRSPRVRRLVMPAWNRIKIAAICRAIRRWPELVSMTMPSITEPSYVMEEISLSCQNFSQLKIMGPFGMIFASSLTTYLPGLKVLSLQFSLVYKDALVHILDDLPQLEVLNISHCVLLEINPPPFPRRIIKHTHPVILSKASRLREFYYCTNEFCIMCQRARNDEGLMRWYKYEEGLWKSDAVKCLAL